MPLLPQPLPQVFSAHAEVVPMLEVMAEQAEGILRARGGSSGHAARP